MRHHFRFLVTLLTVLAAGYPAGLTAQDAAPHPADWTLAQFQAENVGPAAVAARPFVLSAPAETPPAKPRSWKKAWIASWVAFAVINALDAHSSAGRAEANPLLRGTKGTFSGKRAALVKTGAGAGFLAVQWWVGRKNPERYRLFTIANTALNGGLAAIVVRNYRLRSSSSSTPPAYLLRSND